MSQNFTLSTKKLYGMEHINGFHLYVKLNCVEKVPGVTTINWESYLGITGEQSGSYAAAELFLKINSIEGSSSVTSIEAIPWLPNDGWYNFWENGTYGYVIKSGSFDYYHNSSGKASFNITLDANIGGVQDDVYNNFLDTTTKITLTNNIPYTKCGAPTSIVASGTITPNGTFTVSWSGASAGVSNAIKGYEVYYRISSKGSAPTASTYTNKKTVSTTSKSGSVTFTVSGATRGHEIVCGVITKGSVEGYNSSMKTGGSVKINNLPAAPTVSVNKTLVPYNQGKGDSVTFTISGGTDPEGAAVSYSYSTSANGTKTDLGAGKTSFTTTITKAVTYYFWTKDSCSEYSSNSTSKAISINTKPTMTMTFNKTNAENFLISSFKVNFTSGNNGQSTGNKYTFGYKFGNQNYTLLNNTTSTSYEIGDIRNKFSPLDSNKNYELEFFAIRNDGYDTSDKVTAIYSFTTPTITLTNDNNEQSSFSKTVKVSIGSAKGTYTLAKTGQAIVNTDKTGFDTTNVAYGTMIKQINFSEGFSVNTSNSLTKVKAFEFSPSAGKVHPFLTDTFLVYTNNVLNVSFLGKIGSEYGINSVPTLTMQIKDISTSASLTAIGDSSSNNDTFTYSFNGKDLWSTFFTNLQNKTNQMVKISFSLTNNFNDTFTSKTFDLNLDFKGLIEVSTCLLHTNDQYKKGDINYKCLIQDWEYLKETMGIYSDLTVYSFYPVIAQVQTKKDTIDASWENFGASFLLNEENKESNFEYNTARIKYIINRCFYTFKEVLKSFKLDFRVVFSANNSDQVIFEDAAWKNITIKAHQEPVANFASISYINKQLNFKLAGINDGKLPDDSVFDGVSVIIKETNVEVNNFQLNDGTYSITDFSGYFTFSDKVYEFLHLAPIFTSTLTTSLKDSVASYTGKYPTTKSTEQYLYAVIYDISPTIAYRKNHIGINTKEPSMIGDCVVAISDYGDRKKIYLNSSSHNAIVDLSSGNIANFIIDCGEW